MDTWKKPEDYQPKLETLIKSLRQEASDAKSCFTTFSFQSIALSSAALGIIFNSAKNNSMASLAAIPLIGLLMIVCRIGIYKYSAANRAYGLQAYIERTEPLYRTNRLKSEDGIAFETLFENSDWERLFMAWRIVLPTILAEIHIVPRENKYLDLLNLRMYQHTAQYRKMKGPNTYEWFKIKELTGQKYRAGSYLKNMLLALTIMQFLYLVALFIAIFYDIANSSEVSFKSMFKKGILYLPGEVFGSLLKNFSAIFLLMSMLIMLILVVNLAIRTHRRRQLLESGILSIHACAVIWRITLIAHIRAIQKSSILVNGDKIDAYEFDKAYLDFLEKEVDKIRANAIDPSKWLKDNMVEINLLP
jgi:hypothetical protein